MVSQIRCGVLDFIGTACPSIADPFIPGKIDKGRVEDIRECVDCNICVTGAMTMWISRCTQKPTFMEELRKGWHPERMNAEGDSGRVLVICASPARLESTRAAADRGYEVTQADVGTELGGRVRLEGQLPGLVTWGRVHDYPAYQIGKTDNVNVYFNSRLTAQDVLDVGFEHVSIATGSTCRRDGLAQHNLAPLAIAPEMVLFTLDDLMAGTLPAGGEVDLYDDDHSYMGGEKGVEKGVKVTLVTPSNLVSEWTPNTLEQHRIQARMIELGVTIGTAHGLRAVGKSGVTLDCTFTGRTRDLACDALVLVTSRLPNNSLWQELRARDDEWATNGIKSPQQIEDADAPAPIVRAPHAGHRFARELDCPTEEGALSLRREITELAPME